MDDKVIAYKGFKKDLTCRGFQYEIGKEYEEKEVSVCECGFHACENPFDVFNYYGDICNNRFCKVEQSGTIKKQGKKQASSKIKLIAEIGVSGLFKAGIEWIKEITEPAAIIEETKGVDDKDKICSIEEDARICSNGDNAKIGSTGDCAYIGSSGNDTKIGSTGDDTKIGSSGDDAYIGSSGDGVNIGSSGDYAKIGTSGIGAYIGSSGFSANMASSGDYAKIGSSGDYAKIGSSGDYAKIGSSGNYAKIDSAGENSVICCAGDYSAVKAKRGSWITLSEWQYSEEKRRSIPICVKTEFVDGERIKADTWYKLEKGEFVECDR